MTITAAQIRGARGVLNWTQGDLAERTDISATSIGSIESGTTQPRESTLATIQRVFEEAGIEFTDNDGVRVKAGDVKVYKGRHGFLEFYEDIYKTLHTQPGEVIVSNVDERDFEKWLKEDNVHKHVNRIGAIEGVSYRILIREGDTHFLADPGYSKYRWIPKSFFSSVPFYVYDGKLAIILFGAEPTVIVLSYPAVADAYRTQFEALWDLSAPANPSKSEGDR